MYCSEIPVIRALLVAIEFQTDRDHIKTKLKDIIKQVHLIEKRLKEAQQ